jgi:HPt (histidine-containing phosphotransfer) domain-containing protein
MASGESAVSVKALPELPGIVIADGLFLTQNNLRLYRRMLIKFRDRHLDFKKQFIAAQSDSDPHAATRMAHSLKGVAANIGAQGVRHAAQVLELACKGDGDDGSIEDSLNALLNELQPVLEGLKSLDPLPEENPSGPVAAMDADKVATGLRELHDLVSNDNVKAVDGVQRLIRLLPPVAFAPHLERIGKAIEEYDFDAALEALESLARELGIDIRA